MKTRFVSILSLIALIFIISACRKYDEGPLLNLRSPSKKLVGLWEVTSLKVNNVEYFVNYKDTLNANFLIADYDGLYVSIVENSSISSQLASSSLEFEDKNKNMILNFKAQQSLNSNIGYLVDLVPALFEKNSWTIIMLSSTEFKIRKIKEKDFLLRFEKIKS